jgi:hypothetical protein
MAATTGHATPTPRPTDDTLYDRSVRTVVRRGVEPGHLHVVATLQDECLGFGGYQRVHDMRLSVDIRYPEMMITHAEADMSAHPHGACPSTIADVQRLVGLRIAGGFNAELRSRLGGSRSCNHLHTMAQSIAQTTALSHVARHYDDDPVLQRPEYEPFYRRVLDVVPGVVNSCAVLRADGPVVPELLSDE